MTQFKDRQCGPPPEREEVPYDESIERCPFYYIVRIWDHLQVTAMDVIDGMEWDFNYGCAFKYMVRAGSKPNTPEAKDLRKAIKCLERALMKAEAK